jgi:RHS repeat-associated protein
MSAVRSRLVLFVAMSGCGAALLVALVVGSSSEAGTATPDPRAAARAAPSGADVAAQRTEFSRSYRQANGSTRTMVSAVPINYRDGSGGWQPIDTALRSDGAGGLESTAAATEVSLPHDLGDPARVSDGDRWVSFALDGANPDAGAAVKGSSATYGDALTGVDATYEAQPHGVKETLRLSDASAPSSYRFALDSRGGLAPSLRDDGSLVFRDGDGHVRFWLPAPTVKQAGDTSPTTSHVGYRLSEDGATLTVAVDADWLARATFPVEVDPTVFDGAGVTACTLASGSLATTSDCASALVKAGYDGSHVLRTVLRWGSLAADGIPAGAAIDYAQLGLTFESMTNGSAHPQIDVAGLAHTPAAGATWNTYNGSAAWTAPGGDTNPTPSVQPLPWGSNFLGDPGEPLGWDVSGLVQSWLRDPATNMGVLVKAHDEAVNNVMSFDSPTGTAQGPWLAIDWRSRPGSERDQTYENVGISDRSGLSANVVSGNVHVSAGDIHLPGVAGLDLDIARNYNSGDLADQDLAGSAWKMTVNGAALEVYNHFLSAGRTIYANGGAAYRFDRDAAADTATERGYTTPSGIDATMKQNIASGTTTVTFRDGTVWTYSGGDFYVQVLTKIEDRHHNHIDLTYDSAWGNEGHALKKITDTYGRDLTVTRTLPSGTVTGMTDSSGRHWAWAVDAGDHYNLDSAADPDSHTVSYAYTTTIPTVWDQLKTVTDARGKSIKITYDPFDPAKVTKITRVVDGTTTNDVSWQFNYSPAAGTGDACTATGVVGRTVETDPEGHLTTYCYNANGQVIQTFDANHRSVAATYNGAANVATFTGLAGTANPSLTTYGFSSAGNATGASTPTSTGHTQSSTIKYCGTAPGDTGTACSATDSLDQYRPKVTTDSQDTSQAFGYNGTGDLNDVTTTSGGDHQSMTYTAQGEILTSTDGNSRVTNYGYTSHFLTSVTPPAPLAVQKFTADNLSRIASATDGNGITACPTYDGEDRITQVVWRSGVTPATPCTTGTSVKTMTFTHDANGNVTQRVEGANTTTYGYDNLNRRTSEAFPSSRTNTYAYDRASNLKSITDPDGVVSYTYDPANRLATIVSPKPTSGTDTITYSYTDPATSTDPSKQTITFPGGLKQESTSDAAGNILSIKILNSSGTPLKSRSYIHDRSSSATSALIQSVTDDAGNVTTYTHGVADRLTRAKTMNGATAIDQWDYLYDAAGNRTRRTYTVGTGTPTATSYAYNTANELCWSIPGTTPGTPTPWVPCNTGGAGATNYSYDNNGQRTTGATYDALERLTTLGATALSYLSPSNGELVSYGTTGYQNNMLGLARQIPSSGSATDIIRTPNGAPVAQRVSTTNKQSLFSDALGSTIAMADDGANTLSRHYTYTPDGTASTTGSGATTNLLFASGHQLGNLYHYGARYYDPTTATWTQQDPINQIASLTQANRYTYVGGDPTDRVDLAGTCFHQPKSDPFPNVCKSPFYTTHPADDEGEGPCGAKNGSLIAGDCPGPEEGEDSDTYVLPEFPDTPVPGWDPLLVPAPAG